jgi:site-specific DNA-methyltransferase (adenine-specific)
MTIHYQDEQITVHHGDSLDVLREIPDASVDSVCTDPPYGLAELPAATVIAALTAWLTGDREHVPDGRGFMSADWDRFVPPPALWDECFRVLKPGGHLLAFAAPRTTDLMTMSIRLAGFEIRDGIAWLFAQGMPKSLDVSRAIDRRPGVVRHAEFAAHLAARREASGLSRADVSEKVVGTRSGACWNWENHQFPEARWWPALRDLLALDEAAWGPVIAMAEREAVAHRSGSRLAVAPGQGNARPAVTLDITVPATSEAHSWAGWGTALKPAQEPITVARKPLAGTVAATVLAHGTGAINIDGCRTPAGQDYADKCASVVGLASNRNGDAYGEWTGVRQDSTHPAGRWPTNVILDEPAAQALDRDVRDNVSRYFPVMRYEAKADAAERPRVNGIAHTTVKPLALMEWLVRLVTPPSGVCLDPFAGSGTTVRACQTEGFRCIAVEREADYLPLIMSRIGKPVQLDLFTALDGAA